jgi:hypothetical protein
MQSFLSKTKFLAEILQRLKLRLSSDYGLMVLVKVTIRLQENLVSISNII